MRKAIIVHGGAGSWKSGKSRIPIAIGACREAATAGRDILQRGGAALDAVEAAVCVLEACPALNAGRGSYPNADGEVEMDALIMDGLTLDLGAVGAVRRVLHPIALARRLMADSEHTFLVSYGAEAFAQQIGFPRCETRDLLVDKDLNRNQDLQSEPDDEAQEAPAAQEGLDTVGAVALDEEGNLAAATSTGGTRQKKAGRIGDSPLVGSGAYADNWTAAATATGHGEALMKIVISRRVCEFVAAGLSAQAACEAAVRVLTDRVQGRGGVIAVDARGQVGFAYNTAAMPYAFALGQEPVSTGS